MKSWIEESASGRNGVAISIISNYEIRREWAHCAF